MLEKETQKHILDWRIYYGCYQNPVSSNPVFSIWSPGFLLSSPGFLNASPSTSPGFSRVRVFFGSESKSESESGPGFEVCLILQFGWTEGNNHKKCCIRVKEEGKIVFKRLALL